MFGVVSLLTIFLSFFLLVRQTPPPQWSRVSSFLRFLGHTQRRTTVGRTPPDEWSARRRDIYLTTHDSHNRKTSMPPVGFEPTFSARKRPQTYALVRAATGIDVWDSTRVILILKIFSFRTVWTWMWIFTKLPSFVNSASIQFHPQRRYPQISQEIAAPPLLTTKRLGYVMASMRILAINQISTPTGNRTNRPSTFNPLTLNFIWNLTSLQKKTFLSQYTSSNQRFWNTFVH
jgi:hypothetical protein